MLSILFENHDILIIDKPAGLPSQGGEGVGDHVVALVAREQGLVPLPVHRLDRDTAGCMILAKNPSAAARWSAWLEGRVLRKFYRAWVAGIPLGPTGCIDFALPGKKGIQNAQTLWKCLRQEHMVASVSEISLLELELKTGRMHQIRKHLAGIGHPILGDDRHGDFALNRTSKRELGVRSLMLWACRLILPGGTVIESTEPPHFAAFDQMLQRLRDIPRRDGQGEP